MEKRVYIMKCSDCDCQETFEGMKIMEVNFRLLAKGWHKRKQWICKDCYVPIIQPKPGLEMKWVFRYDFA